MLPKPTYICTNQLQILSNIAFGGKETNQSHDFIQYRVKAYQGKLLDNFDKFLLFPKSTKNAKSVQLFKEQQVCEEVYGLI